MIRFIFISVFVFSGIYCYVHSQTVDINKKKADSLKSLLASHKEEDSVKVDLLIKTGTQSPGYEGIPFYKEAIRIAQKKS